MPRTAEVEPMTTARALRGPFDYRLPEELREGAVEVGSMLVVPFGRREVLGVVVGLANSSEVQAHRLLAPRRALELGVPAELVETAEWIAKEYCSTPARALALGQGRGVLVLVPEIALTPQITWRFIERFGDTVAVLHSQLRPAERYAEWRRLRAGEARVCVGPRSAVFAPIEDLGLIVVDEEHESSYKHEGDPRYDAREVAAERARRSGALLVLGSATPRPESVRGLPRSSLPRRVDGRPLPRVHVLDMCGRRHGLHPLTAQALAEVRGSRGKAVVLLNRRGWSNFLSCLDCGGVWSCPHCDVALVLHRAGGFVACHHCGHRERVPERCGQCESTSVA